MNAQPAPLIGRDRELEALSEFSDALLRGGSRSIVLSGEPGIGKTAILDHVIARHRSWQVATCVGLKTEAELSWAGLLQLCADYLELLPQIPPPQAEALRCAFGLGVGGAADPFLCCLAAWNLLAAAAESGPVIWIIDDADDLDHATLRTLGFIGRRMDSEGVGILFAARDTPNELIRIPHVALDGLHPDEAAALLDHCLRVRLDPAVRTWAIAEAGGNPAALVEFASRANEWSSNGGEGPLLEASPLTAQQLRIAQLAAEGLSNSEIASRLYLSRRTVESHLYQVYPKLGISSRSQLHIALRAWPSEEVG